jgi:hypothetical protein
MLKKTSKKSLLDAYQFDGFKTGKLAKGKFGDKTALVLSLSRRSKKVCAGNAAASIVVGTTGRSRRSVICRAVIAAFISSLKSDVSAAARRA